MADLGYRQCDGNRFVREGQYADPFKTIRTSASRDLLGVGMSSYSHVGTAPAPDGRHGYVFRNDPSLRTYIDRVSAGGSPILTGRVVDDEELLAMSYATGLRRGRIEDSALGAIAARCTRLAAQYRAQADRLTTLGILETYADASGCEWLRLTDLGRLFEDETLSLFFSPSVQRAIACARVEVSAPTFIAAA